MDVTQNFQDYYSPNFIDPLYRPYIQKRTYNFNPMMMNLNEIRYNKGLTFKLKNANTCPIGFKKELDYCIRDIKQVPIFYTQNQNEMKEYFRSPVMSIMPLQ